MRSDDAAQAMMRDLRVLGAAEMLLLALSDGASAFDVLALTARHAESVAMCARVLLLDYEGRSVGHPHSPEWGGSSS